MADPVAPPGGFQQGGWYEGRQYWNGTFSAPGQINSQSNQQGAGQNVSNEVIAQTNPNNVAYVNQQKQASGVSSYLNDYQSSLYGAVDLPGVQTSEEILKSLRDSGLLPSNQAPEAPNLTETFQTLSEERGLDAIQASINEFKAQQDEIAAQLRVNKSAEMGKPVAQNVIEGRIGEQERTAQENYDFVSRQLSRKTDEYNSALSSIQMIMDFTQKDFDNASQSYTQQFEQAISTINLIRGIQSDQKDDVQRAQDNARANAQIMVNLITAGNLSLDQMSPDQQAQLNKLEVQSGLPMGFFQSIQMDAGANIIATNEVNGQIQVLMRNGDGSLTTQTYGQSEGGGSGSGGNTGSAKDLSSAIADMSSQIRTRLNSYNDISPNDWNVALSAWLGAGFKKADFIANFGQYADTNRGDFQSVYGFKNPVE